MSNESCLAEFFRKSNNLMDPLKFETKGKICESVHFYLSFGNMCIALVSLSFRMLFSCVFGLEYVSCLGTSKKLSLGV